MENQEEPRITKRQQKFRKPLGILALLVGLMGLILPIIPGWLLIFVGLELIGINFIFKDEIKAFLLSKIVVKKKKNKHKNH